MAPSRWVAELGAGWSGFGWVVCRRRVVGEARDRGGAVGLAADAESVGCAPQDRAGGELGVGEAVVGLEVVVSLAQQCQVRCLGLSAGLGVVVVVGDGVVVLAGQACGVAAGEDAGAVAQADLLGQPGRDLVGVGVQVFVQVDHRSHADSGAWVGAPVSDGVRGDCGGGVLDPPDQPITQSTAAAAAVVLEGREHGGVGQVQVEHDLPFRWHPSTGLAPDLGVGLARAVAVDGLAVPGEVLASEVAEGAGPPGVQVLC